MRYQVCVAVLVSVVGLTIGDKSGKSFSPMYKNHTFRRVISTSQNAAHQSASEKLYYAKVYLC